MIRIDQVDPDGPLGSGRVAAGDGILAINGVAMRDLLDIRFASAEERLAIDFVRPDGSRFTLQVRKDPDADLGLRFEPMRIRSCNNKCDFCFVFQQPRKSMRRELYVMDDDYRYSFLFGNFITLTNVDEDDLRRIRAQRLSPLYISVHATDDAVRRAFLRNASAPPILPLLRRLAAWGIRMHTQVVLIPDLNDGPVLERTIADLADLHPAVESLAVVPVGLTRHRADLPAVRRITRPYARRVVRALRARTEALRARLGSGFLYTADEFYVQAGLPFPRAPYYDDYSQFENGVGMCRQLLDHAARELGRMPSRLESPLALFWVTGTSAATFLLPRVIEPLSRIGNLHVEPVIVTNRFYGSSVTVSGLLTGRDVREALLAAGPRDGLVLLPPNCLNHDGLFLDDLSAAALSAELGVPVVGTDYRFGPGLKSLLLSRPRMSGHRAA